VEPLNPLNDADTVTERSPATIDSIRGVNGRLGGRLVVVGAGRVVVGVVGRVTGIVGMVGAGGTTLGTDVGAAVVGAVGSGTDEVGGAAMGDHAESTKSNPLGDPAPLFPTTPTVADEMSPRVTSLGVAVGQTLRKAAAAPAT